MQGNLQGQLTYSLQQGLSNGLALLQQHGLLPCAHLPPVFLWEHCAAVQLVEQVHVAVLYQASLQIKATFSLSVLLQTKEKACVVPEVWCLKLQHVCPGIHGKPNLAEALEDKWCHQRAEKKDRQDAC